MSCEGYPTASNMKLLATDAQTINEVVTSAADLTTPASDGEPKTTLAGLYQKFGGINVGDYANGTVLNEVWEYAYNPLTGYGYVVKSKSSLPYAINESLYPDPESDPNLKRVEGLTVQGLATYTDLVFSTTSEMQSNSTGVIYQVGMPLKVQDESGTLTNYVVDLSGDVDLGGGLFARKVTSEFSRNFLRSKAPIPQKYSRSFIESKFNEVIPEVLFFPSAILQYVQLVSPITNAGGDVTFRVYHEGILGLVDQSPTTGFYSIVGTCASLDRTSFSTSSGAITDKGSYYDIVLTNPPSDFVACDIRAGASISGGAKITRFEVIQGGEMITTSLLDRHANKELWGGSTTYQKKIESIGMDHRITIQLGSDSYFNSKSEFFCENVDNDDDISKPRWSFELNLKWAGIVSELEKWRFSEGDHFAYRRSNILDFTSRKFIRGDNATIYGGRPIPTSAWSLVQSSPRYVYSASYDWDTNPDSAIRSGTKQPFVAVEVPKNKTKSQASFELTNVASQSDVLNNDYSYYYDYATKTLYFSWDAANDSAFIYIAESDVVIRSTSTLLMAGVNVKAGKSWSVRSAPASYTKHELGGPFFGAYECGAGVSVGGDGAFSVDYIDSEQIQCEAYSHNNEGFNYHFDGVSLLRDCVSIHNGDDGISHHENCIGYVVDSQMHYNYSASSVPAFGARVYHYSCSSLPATVINPSKPYAGMLASISGQGANTIAWYKDCYSDTRGIATAHYRAESQQAGQSATIYIDGAQVENENETLFEEANAESDVFTSKVNTF